MSSAAERGGLSRAGHLADHPANGGDDRATVSWVATASSGTVESDARRRLPARTPVAAITCLIRVMTRFGSDERDRRRRK